MAFKLPESKDIQKIPKMYREAFESLRDPNSDPVGSTWAITQLTDDEGKTITAIVTLTYDPVTSEPQNFVPVFIAYPHTEEEIKRYETTHENTSTLVN